MTKSGRSAHTKGRRSKRARIFQQLAGSTVADGRFRLERLVAVGGSGGVFRAWDEDTGQRAAIKVIPLGSDTRAERARRERAALQGTEHPNLVRYLAGGSLTPRLAWLATEWLEGPSLSRHVRAKGPLGVTEAIDIARQVLAALAALHARGIVHRDVKPGNVVLLRAGGTAPVAKLIDLDVAHVPSSAAEAVGPLTARGHRIGTPGFTPPEQAAGLPVDGRADLWAVGRLLRWMMTGVTGGSEPAGLPPSLAVVLGLCDATDPDRRPPTAAALDHLLEAALAEGVGSAPPFTTAPTAPVQVVRAQAPTVLLRAAFAAAPTVALNTPRTRLLGRRRGAAPTRIIALPAYERPTRVC